MPSSNQLYLPSINSFFSKALIFLGILTVAKIAFDLITVFLLGHRQKSVGGPLALRFGALGLFNRFLLIVSAIVLCTIIFIIFKAAIPQGTALSKWLNNDYAIITLGLFLWFIGPTQKLLARKNWHFDPSLIGGVLSGWIIVGIIVGTILWAKDGQHGNISNYFMKGIAMTSLGVFAMVLILEKRLQTNEKDNWIVNLFNRLFPKKNPDDRNEDPGAVSVYSNNNFSDSEEANYDDDVVEDYFRESAYKDQRAGRSKRSRRY
jgi:hypothetical protein